MGTYRYSFSDLRISISTQANLRSLADYFHLGILAKTMTNRTRTAFSMMTGISKTGRSGIDRTTKIEIP